MQCRLGEIDKLHGILVHEMSPAIYGATRIDQSPRFRETAAWREEGFEGALEFSLWNEPLAAQVRDNGRPVHELRDVGDNSASGWFSWHEEWKKLRGETAYTLVDVGLVFSWGPRTQLDQLFRAEWTANGIAHAAHPHWHADCAVLGTEYGIDRIHFGMGGWNNSTTRIECWQVEVDRPESVREWAVKTLFYCRDQLQRYPPY